MTQPNDGGPAFPQIYEFHDDDADKDVLRVIPGISIRDYFAVHATDEDISEQQEWTPNTKIEGYGSNARPKLTNVQCRYKHADAMLKQRGVNP